MGRFRRFCGDGRGSTAVEFAIVAVPFLGLLAALFETALVMFATSGVEAAVGDAARLVMTGQAQTYTTSTAFRDATICSPTAHARILPSFIDCSKLMVDVRPAGTSGSTSFSSADTTRDFTLAAAQTYCPGAPGDIVVVRAAYPMPVYFSIIIATQLAASGTLTSGLTSWNGGYVHMILGTSAFRNEAYTQTANAGC